MKEKSSGKSLSNDITKKDSIKDCFPFKQKQKGYSSIIGGILLNLILGSIYCWGNLDLYVSSYFTYISPTFNSSESLLIFPLLSFSLHFCAPLSFKISEKIGFKVHLASCVFFLSCSVYFAFDFGNFSSFALIYGAGFGSFTGFAVLVILFNVYKYFPNRKGFVSGIILGSFGLSALISNIVIIHFLNPNNVLPIKKGEIFLFPEEICQALPHTFKKIAFFYLVLGLLGVLLSWEGEILMLKIEETELIKIGQSDGKAKDDTDIEKIEIKNGWKEDIAIIPQSLKKISTKEALKSRLFLCLFAVLIFSTSGGFFQAVNSKNLGLLSIPDEQFLNYVGSVGALANGGGRVIWGFIMDKFQFRKSYLTLLFLQISQLVSLKFILSEKWVYFGYIAVSYFCLGGHFVLFPAFTVQSFGEAKGPQIYGFLLWGAFLGNFLQTSIVLGMEQWLGLENLPFIFVFLNIICIILELCKKP